MNNLKLKSARIYLTSNNLFVINKIQGVDPEVNMGGIEPGIDNNNFIRRPGRLC